MKEIIEKKAIEMARGFMEDYNFDGDGGHGKEVVDIDGKDILISVYARWSRDRFLDYTADLEDERLFQDRLFF